MSDVKRTEYCVCCLIDMEREQQSSLAATCSPDCTRIAADLVKFACANEPSDEWNSVYSEMMEKRKAVPADKRVKPLF